MAERRHHVGGGMLRRSADGPSPLSVERGVDLGLSGVRGLPVAYVGFPAGLEFLVGVEEVTDLNAHEVRDILQVTYVGVPSRHEALPRATMSDF